jgi:small-conductance mechanosensitive channel
VLLLAAAVSAEDVSACGDTASAACLFVYRRTQNEVLARAADWLIARPLRIGLILLLAVIASRFLQGAIARFVDGVERAARREPDADGARGAGLRLTGQLGERAHQRAETIAAVLRSLAKAVIAVVASLMVLAELDLNLGPLLAGAGIVGIAVGFGAQTLVRDFLSGIFMLIEDQFGVGDIIDVGEASGVVEGVSLRTTRLRDVEGVVWHIPNGEIKRVGNKSQDWSRALLDVQVAHGTDLAEAQQVIKTVADRLWTDEQWSTVILAEPEVWGVEQLAASGITLRLVVKTRPSDQYRVLRTLRQEVSAAFDAAGIKVPAILPVTPLIEP